nr:MAG TPA: hypothetical protein [Caudoviricetes sp.]
MPSARSGVPFRTRYFGSGIRLYQPSRQPAPASCRTPRGLHAISFSHRPLFLV